MAISPNIQELDLGLNNCFGYKKIKMKQYDKNLRELRFTLIEDGEIVVIPSSYYAKFQATKRDETIIFDDCTIEGNVIVYTPDEQLTAKDGKVIAEIGLYKPNSSQDVEDSGLIQSVTFEIMVEKSAMNRNAVISSNEFNALTIMINTITGLVISVESALVNISTAITNAESATQNAITATTSANSAASLANTKAELANEKALLADTSTTNANNAAYLANEKAILADSKASLADIATTNANTATTNAITATNNANTATDNTYQAILNANTATEKAIAAIGDLQIIEFDMDGGGAVNETEYIDANGGGAVTII